MTGNLDDTYYPTDYGQADAAQVPSAKRRELRVNSDYVCGQCQFWKAGLCKRFPPQLILWPSDNQHPISYIPVTSFPDRAADDEACGEYKLGFAK